MLLPNYAHREKEKDLRSSVFSATTFGGLFEYLRMMLESSSTMVVAKNFHICA